MFSGFVVKDWGKINTINSIQPAEHQHECFHSIQSSQKCTQCPLKSSAETSVRRYVLVGSSKKVTENNFCSKKKHPDQKVKLLCISEEPHHFLRFVPKLQIKTREKIEKKLLKGKKLYHLQAKPTTANLYSEEGTTKGSISILSDQLF